MKKQPLSWQGSLEVSIKNPTGYRKGYSDLSSERNPQVSTYDSLSKVFAESTDIPSRLIIMQGRSMNRGYYRLDFARAKGRRSQRSTCWERTFTRLLLITTASLALVWHSSLQAQDASADSSLRRQQERERILQEREIPDPDVRLSVPADQ